MSQTLFNTNQLGPNTAVVRQDFTATATDATTVYMNGQLGVRQFGGKSASSITIMEIAQ